MSTRHNVTILYDQAEDEEKRLADERGEPYPLVYEQVGEALRSRGHEVRVHAVPRRLRSLVNDLERDGSDVLFNLCESYARFSRHDHNLPGVLELLERPFTGTGSKGSLLCTDKGITKKILQFHGLPSPRFLTFEAGRVEWADNLEFPLFVKPLDQEASIGIDQQSVVHNVKELLERISTLHEALKGPVLVEEYIEGREMYVGVLGNDPPRPLPLLEWDLWGVPGPRIACAAAKWDHRSAGHQAPERFPTDIPEPVVARIQEAAVQACKLLQVSDYARIDLRVVPPRPGARPSGALIEAPQGWRFYMLEVNPNPWLEQKAEFALAAARAGWGYPELLEQIVQMAVDRHRRLFAGA